MNTNKIYVVCGVNYEEGPNYYEEIKYCETKPLKAFFTLAAAEIFKTALVAGYNKFVHAGGQEEFFDNFIVQAVETE